MAMGRGEAGGFTVPAINLRDAHVRRRTRGLPRREDARRGRLHLRDRPQSEIGYTDQRPGEYAAVVLAAAIAGGLAGPVFIQGDHFQVNAKKYAADPETELDRPSRR